MSEEQKSVLLNLIKFLYSAFSTNSFLFKKTKSIVMSWITEKRENLIL